MTKNELFSLGKKIVLVFIGGFLFGFLILLILGTMLDSAMPHASRTIYLLSIGLPVVVSEKLVEGFNFQVMCYDRGIDCRLDNIHFLACIIYGLVFVVCFVLFKIMKSRKKLHSVGLEKKLE
jgi:ABC-type polysaccharide transport system permease subunit